jgi:hypothetical protein
MMPGRRTTARKAPKKVAIAPRTKPAKLTSKKATKAVKAEKAGYVKNPFTGRMIKVGGATWQQVFGEPTTAPQKTARGRRLSPDEEVPELLIEKILEQKTATIEELQDTLARTTQPSLIVKLKQQIKNKAQGRGSRTRGWRARAPQPGKPRKLLHSQCGDAAFLMPNELKFPIMAKCGTGAQGTCKCEIDCQGVLSAYVRARQWKYTNVANAAKMLLNSKCKAGAAAVAAMEA